MAAGDRKPGVVLSGRFRAATVITLALALGACSNLAAPAPTPTYSPIQEEGLRLFNLNCASCHATSPETIIVGPSLHEIAVRAEERIPGMDPRTYLQVSILDPTAYIVEGFPDSMPKDLGKRLTGEEFDAIIDYLLTLE